MGKRRLVLVGESTAPLRTLLERSYELTIADEESACDVARATVPTAVIVGVSSSLTARTLAERLRDVVSREALLVGVGERPSAPWYLAAFDYWFDPSFDMRELHAVLRAAPKSRR
jgi:hypothetical protein